MSSRRFSGAPNAAALKVSGVDDALLLQTERTDFVAVVPVAQRHAFAKALLLEAGNIAAPRGVFIGFGIANRVVIHIRNRRAARRWRCFLGPTQWRHQQ